MNASAADILWLKLTPHFSYRDISVACSNTTHSTFLPNELFLSLEIDGGKVTRAILRDRPTKSPRDYSASVEFSKEELGGLAVYQDKLSRLWLKAFSLSGKVLNWIFYRTIYQGTCEPSQKLKTLGPQPSVFEFDLSALDSGIASSDSKKSEYKGELVDGGTYQATLSFIQRQ